MHKEIITDYNNKKATGMVAFLIAPRLGFEPRTLKLTASCSTAELSRNNRYKVFYHQTQGKSRLGYKALDKYILGAKIFSR